MHANVKIYKTINQIGQGGTSHTRQLIPLAKTVLAIRDNQFHWLQ